MGDNNWKAQVCAGMAVYCAIPFPLTNILQGVPWQIAVFGFAAVTCFFVAVFGIILAANGDWKSDQ